MTTTIVSEARETSIPVSPLPRTDEQFAAFPKGAFDGPFLEGRDVLAVFAVALMTLGPLAALPLGF